MPSLRYLTFIKYRLIHPELDLFANTLSYLRYMAIKLDLSLNVVDGKTLLVDSVLN